MKAIKDSKGSFKKDVFFLCLFYIMAFGIILFNDGVLGDEWTCFNSEKANILSLYGQVGVWWYAHYLITALSLKTMLVFRLVTFFTYLLSGIFLYLILRNIKEIGGSERFFISLFFMLFPVNFARISFFVNHYAICYFLFFLGFFVLSEYLKKKKILLRVIALLALLFSFYPLNSLLLFYVIVLLYIMYVENIRDISRFKTNLLRYADFIILPVLFWQIKKLFFMPYGLCARHNAIELCNLPQVPNWFLVAFRNSFLEQLDISVRLVLGKTVLILGASFAIYLFLRNKITVLRNNKNDRRFFILGGLAIFLGILPYVLLGKVLGNADWSSRDQILVPLGASLILYYGLKIFMSEFDIAPKARNFIYSIFITTFIVMNFSGYLEYQKDWFKQLSLIENFKDSAVLRDNTTFLFSDNTTDLNARNRQYRFYEYNGLMKYAFGNERRFGTPDSTRYVETVKEFGAFGQYNCSGYKLQRLQYEVIIDRGEYKPKSGGLDIIRLMALKYAKPEQFRTKIKNLVKLEYVKL